MQARSTGGDPPWEPWLERALFASGLLALAVPVLVLPYCHTLDGPAHLYNAVLWRDLLLDRAPASALLQPVPLPVPNTLGHGLLMLLGTLLPPLAVLRTAHLLLLLALPLAFRALLRAQEPARVPWTALFIFPLAVNAPLQLGFYNFCLALALLPLALRAWMRIEEPGAGAWRRVHLAGWLLLLYFAHEFVFLVVLLWTGLRCVPHLVQRPGEGRKLALSLLLSALPGLVLWGWYAWATEATGWTGEGTGLWPSVRWNFCLVSLELEEPLWMGVLLISVCWGLAAWLRWREPAERARSPWSHALAPWLPVLVLAVVAVFAPDRLGSGGAVQFRVVLVWHMVLFAALATLRVRPVFAAISGAALIGITVAQAFVRQAAREAEVAPATATLGAGPHVPSGSTVATLTFDWRWSHLPELALTGKDVLFLSNYELWNPHFPVRWRRTPAADTARARSCAPDLSNLPLATLRQADVLFVMGDVPAQRDSCTERLMRWMEQEFAVVHDVAPCRVLLRNTTATSRPPTGDGGTHVPLQAPPPAPPTK